MVGCVARNQPRKNLPALVKAFALLAGRIEKLYRDPGLVTRYSQAGLAFARSLSWDELMPRWLELIRATARADLAT